MASPCFLNKITKNKKVIERNWKIYKNNWKNTKILANYGKTELRPSMMSLAIRPWLPRISFA